MRVRRQTIGEVDAPATEESPPAATVTSTAELPCSATPTAAARCAPALATSFLLQGRPGTAGEDWGTAERPTRVSRSQPGGASTCRERPRGRLGEAEGALPRPTWEARPTRAAKAAVAIATPKELRARGTRMVWNPSPVGPTARHGRNHQRTSLVRSREHTGETHRVHPRRRDRRSQKAEQRERIEIDGDGGNGRLKVRSLGASRDRVSRRKPQDR